MSGIDWRRAQFVGKRSLSVSDEKEYRERDAAARWLERKAELKARLKADKQWTRRRRNGALV